MRKILGYKLDKLNGNGHMILEVHMPAEILSVVEQHNEIIAYAIADDDDQTTPIDILVIGTGTGIKDDIDTYKFVGTVKLDNGGFVLHVFYRYVDILGDDPFILSETNRARVKDLYIKEHGGRGGIMIS